MTFLNRSRRAGSIRDIFALVRPLSKTLLLILLGILSLSFGANIFITGAIDIARYFGISEVVIGMTIVALGTSLPELATSVIAAFRKEVTLVKEDRVMHEDIMKMNKTFCLCNQLELCH